MDTWKLRLLQDIRELHFDPTPGVDVTIDDKDISQMCLVLTPQEGSPYLGLRLHFTVYIPTTYPMQPPEVTVNTSIAHPNVFGDFLCADVLKNEHEVAYDRALGYNGGYSPAYLLKNIFMNLLSFFGSNKVEQTGGYTASVNYQNHKYSNATICANFACPRCNFNMPGGLPGVIVSSADVAPGITPATSMDVDTVDNTMTAPTLARMARPTQARTLDRLPEDVWALIADDLPDQAIHCFCQVYPRFARIVRDYNLIIRRGLVCFYLRKPFTEAILGIGIQATVKGRKIDIRAREFELFSQEAFANCHLRRGIWNEPFTHFLPVALSTAHFERALPAIRESLLLLAAENQPRCPTWTPTLVLQIIPKMCNQMVLNLVEACSTSTTSIHTTTRLCASEKALTGYYLLLHLAQMLVRHHPTLQTHISTRLRDFVASVASRHKSVVPDLGEFLIYAMLDTDDAARGPAAWRDRLSVPFLAELLTRQVVWQLDPSKGNRPHLAYLEPADSPPSLSRLRDAFVASVTSMKLVMFQVTFLKLVRQNPPSEDRYGYPLSALPERLLRIVHDIDDLGARVLDAPVGDAGIPDVIDAWDGFLTILDIPVPDSGPAPGSRKDTIAAFVSRHLRNAVADSFRSGYHFCPYSTKQLYWMRRRIEPAAPAPIGWDNHGLEETRIRHGRSLPVLSFFPRAAQKNAGFRIAYEEARGVQAAEWTRRRGEQREKWYDDGRNGESRSYNSREREYDDMTSWSRDWSTYGRGRDGRDRDRRDRDRRDRSPRDRRDRSSYGWDRDRRDRSSYGWDRDRRDRDSYGRDRDPYRRDGDTYGKDGVSYARGRDSYERGRDSYERGRDSYERGRDSYERGRDSYERGRNSYERGRNSYERDRGPYEKERDRKDKSPYWRSRDRMGDLYEREYDMYRTKY